jgi:hypothetical protein
MEHLTLKRLREGASFMGDPGRYVKKGFGYRNLHWGPFAAEENLEGGSYTAEFDRCVKEGSFTGDPRRYVN